MMHIGLVSVDFFPHVGGIAAHVRELGRALVQLGHRVHVFTVPILDTTAGDSELDGMQIHRLDTPLFKPVYSWQTHRALKKAIARHHIDVLHVHGIRPLEATRNLDVPVVFTNHSSGFLKRVAAGPRQQRRIAKRLRHVCHVLAPSQELVDRTLDVGYSGPVDFISNGVDTDKFTPGLSPARDAWNVSPDTPVLLLARRLVEKNGVTVFADALTHLKQHDWVAVFAGDGDQRGKIENTLANHQLMPRCRMLGSVPNPDMPALYRGADISVLPSYMEATSITGLESMSTALPLVGTRVGGIPTLVDEGHTGLLVPPGDPRALADALAELITDPQRRRAMGKAARQRAVDHFSWKSIAAQTAAAYQSHRTPQKMAA
jgi:glycosyltransferase involved in cell wall biosynthesis